MDLDNLNPANWQAAQWTIAGVAAAALAFVNRSALGPVLSKLRGLLPNAKPSAGGGLAALESALVAVVACGDACGIDARPHAQELMEEAAKKAFPPKGAT